jgi:hypothetical protein
MELDCLMGYHLPQAFYDSVFRTNASRILQGITGQRPEGRAQS